MIKKFLLVAVPILLLFSCRNSKNSFETIVPSPELKTHLYLNLNDGEPYFLVFYKTDLIIDWSMLGFIMDDTIKFHEGLYLNSIKSKSSLHSQEDFSSAFENQIGIYNECTIQFRRRGVSDIYLSIVFRVYDNAIAFKYVFDQISNISRAKEITELDLPVDLFKEIAINKNFSSDSLNYHLSLKDADTIDLPCTFISESKINVYFTQSISQNYTIDKLVRQTRVEDENRFVVASVKKQGIDVYAGFETPWRIIYILDDEE